MRAWQPGDGRCAGAGRDERGDVCCGGPDRLVCGVGRFEQVPPKQNPATTTVLIARCDNYRDVLERPCDGTLRYRWGQGQAACGTCGAWTGIAVARWLRVETPDAPPAEADDAAPAAEAHDDLSGWLRIAARTVAAGGILTRTERHVIETVVTQAADRLAAQPPAAPAGDPT